MLLEVWPALRVRESHVLVWYQTVKEPRGREVLERRGPGGLSEEDPMRPEQKLWSRLRNHMKHSGWDATRHEDAATFGTPDVSWGARGINGWLELKVIGSITAPIKLRPAQKAFLHRRAKTGGHCGVLVWVEKTEECLVFVNEQIKSLGCGKLPQESISCHGLPEPVRLLDVLTKHYLYGEL